jgi:hypothetical protein
MLTPLQKQIQSINNAMVELYKRVYALEEKYAKLADKELMLELEMLPHPPRRNNKGNSPRIGLRKNRVAA